MDLLTVREAAAMLRVSQVTLRRYVASGKLPAVRVGRNVRIERNAAEDLVGVVIPSADATAGLGGDIQNEGKVFTLDSPFWDIVGIIDDDGPTDVAANKHKYLADAYDALHRG